jgi:NADH ubiquinone oxidoreductase, 20 Kd subunit
VRRLSTDLARLRGRAFGGRRRVRDRVLPRGDPGTVEGPYDVSLVEGSIATGDDAERIKKIRADSKALITIGACATAGGIQALRAPFAAYNTALSPTDFAHNSHCTQ